jgi:hypothetical protein
MCYLDLLRNLPISSASEFQTFLDLTATDDDDVSDTGPKTSFWHTFAPKSNKPRNKPKFEHQSTPINDSFVIRMKDLKRQSKKKVSIQDRADNTERNEPLIPDVDLTTSATNEHFETLSTSAENENAISTAAQIHSSDV